MKSTIKKYIRLYQRQYYRYLPSYHGIFSWTCMASLILMPWQQAAAYSTSMEYYHHNHQGSLLEVYDGATNKRLLSQAWSPWGERQVLYAAAGNENSAASLLSRGLPVRMGYTGHKELLATRLTFAGDTRLYDARLKRFLNSDDRTTGGIRGQNRYSYAYNNPISYIDPDGRAPRGILARTAATISRYLGRSRRRENAFSLGQTAFATAIESVNAAIADPEIAATTIQAYMRRYLYKYKYLQIVVLATKEFDRRFEQFGDISHHPAAIRDQLQGRLYLHDNDYQTLRNEIKEVIHRNLRHPPRVTHLVSQMTQHFFQIRDVMRSSFTYGEHIVAHSLPMNINGDIINRYRVFLDNNEELRQIEHAQTTRSRFFKIEQVNASFLYAFQTIYPDLWQQALSIYPNYSTAVNIYGTSTNAQVYYIVPPADTIDEWFWSQGLPFNIRSRGG